MQKQKGLTAFNLKIIAIFLMVLDHIHTYFYHIGAPDWFKMVGRLVAPIFIFLVSEGFYYTRSRKRYMLHLLFGFWGCNVIFFIVTYFFNTPLLQLNNSIIGTFFISALLMWIWEGFVGKEKYKDKAILGLSLFIFLATSFDLLIQLPISFGIKRFFILLVPFPTNVEGGLFVISMTFLLYVFRFSRIWQYLIIVFFSIYAYFEYAGTVQWMMIFSIIPLALYNGREGKKMQWLFYLFYPIHLSIIYIIAYYVYRL